jgi:hypothetical protein
MNLKRIACKLKLEQGVLRQTSQPLNVELEFYRSFLCKVMGSKHSKVDQKVCPFNSKF